MRHVWEWALCIYLLVIPATVLAEDDPDYKPWSNFRPDNVTGLHHIYSWVGSYYNVTTEVELTPKGGWQKDTIPCPNQQNVTTVLKWPSILSITERGPYNQGINPVNLWLMRYSPDQDLWTLPGNRALFKIDSSPTLPISSSELTWKYGENTTVPDNFNMTATKNQNSGFSLSGTMENIRGNSSWLGDIDMPACNTSTQCGKWKLQLMQSWVWNRDHWKGEFAPPNMTTSFDGHTANLTMEGDYTARPYLRSNYSGAATISGSDAVQGKIRINVKGVLDTYHSDILNVNSTSKLPTWLRTVGFGNNTLNVDNSSSGRLRLDLWSALVIPFVAVALIVYI